MVYRIEVGYNNAEYDAAGHQVLHDIREDLGFDGCTLVRVVDVYQVDGNITSAQAARIAKELLADPIVQHASVSRALAGKYDWAVEVGLKPGVTDNVAVTTVEGIDDLLKKKFKGSLKTLRQYRLTGKISESDVQLICNRLLVNPVIEMHQYWRTSRPAAKKKVKTTPPKGGRVEVVELPDVDETLNQISQDRVLSLTISEMRAVREYCLQHVSSRKSRGLSASPTDVELEMLAQTWSEHCKHKIFNADIRHTDETGTKDVRSIYKKYIRGATEKLAARCPWLVSVFVDNAGIIDFDDKYNLTFKVETHNHPSALEPYGGAITGIVGVNRDILGAGMGAYPIFNTDVFCFADPRTAPSKVPSGLLHPKRIFKGVRRGVEDGGNKIGIPTINGTVRFDEKYLGNPLVFCGTGGLIPKRLNGKDAAQKHVKPGDLIVMVGGRIGKDGIHGATFSSMELDESSNISAVQIGAPIVQKKMQEALMEARDRGLYSAITDNGAGGLSSSVGEMAEFTNGCEVDLEQAPLKYAGLDPWEIWVSEAQERMTVAVPKRKVQDFLDLCESRDVEATVLGKFTKTGYLHIKFKNKSVAYLDMEFVHHGLAPMRLESKWTPPKRPVKAHPEPQNCSNILLHLLGKLNICSKEWVIRQYDHEVQGMSVVKPLVGENSDGPGDAGILRPLNDSERGVVVSNGINTNFGDIDTYWMAANVIDEAIRNIVAVGGDCDRIALLDNFCWGNPVQSKSNPEGAYKLAQLVRAGKACYDMATAFGTPFISGKDSFYNEYQIGKKTVAIPPTLLISAIGLMPDVSLAVTSDSKNIGDLVYVLGATKSELGGSEYYKHLRIQGGDVPVVEPRKARSLYRVIRTAVHRQMINAMHDCSEGGISVALAEMCIGGNLGMAIDLKPLASSVKRVDTMLFSESASRLIVTVPPKKKQAFENLFRNQSKTLLGTVTEEDRLICVGPNSKRVISCSLSALKTAWKKTLSW
jgi:phosphoribosylformylglycinamidine synthase subunit PurSL